jgi:hypothetical protein
MYYYFYYYIIFCFTCVNYFYIHFNLKKKLLTFTSTLFLQVILTYGFIEISNIILNK